MFYVCICSGFKVDSFLPTSVSSISFADVELYRHVVAALLEQKSNTTLDCSEALQGTGRGPIII
jgi:hypothetical protein